jgi:hypothetical protein
MAGHRIYKTSLASVSPHYVKKGRTKEEVDELRCWLAEDPPYALIRAASLPGRGRASAGPKQPRSRAAVVPPGATVGLRDPEATLAGRSKTTFAKMNRETKVREKRQATLERKEQRQRDREAGVEIEHQEEDLSHLDVDHVQGVEPDVSVKR